ncbi:MAG TPA: hypothetical protein VNM24_03945 [Burkholderiales bacterium]|jgi:hypothetical protein|nr:hypothetical protein [Burkholderiales bacterium]
MNRTAVWRIVLCATGLVAATHALPYPNCEDDASAAAMFLSTRIATGEGLDNLYDHYFVRALQKQMERASFVALSRSINPSASVRPILMKPVIRQADQLAVRRFTGLSGAAVEASVGVLTSRSAEPAALLMTLQCWDGQWKVAGIKVADQ